MKRDKSLIQTDTFTLNGLGDLPQHGTGLVIPLPKNRALRIGVRFSAWCRVGPRRYNVVASPNFVESYARMMGASEEDAKEHLRSIGIHLQGELEAAPEPEREADGAE